MIQDTAAAAFSPDSVPSTGEAIGLITDKLSGWLETTIAMTPNLVLAVAIAVAFWFLGSFARRLFDRILVRAIPHRQIAHLIAKLAGLLVIVMGLFFALSVMGLTRTVTTLLAGAGVIGLALGFAFQDTAANFISGVMLAIRQPFRIGDLVEAKGVFGKVEDTNLRSTLIRRLDGPRVYIPNADVFKNPLINYSVGNGRRVEIATGVAYADDLARAEEVAKKAASAVSLRDDSRDPECYWSEFGDSSINCVIRFWIEETDQASYLEAKSEAIRRVKAAFDEHDISIPFPIRTLDFGIEGGESLAEVLDSRWGHT